ncbi:hypothetical protein A6A06_16200 [Streptomyces sp. CB02923]|uniref:hypothetical protein n=1 Tax=Streptomyces sp. CB02923 TaxID=1718985 RepID=UPI00093EC309|nr:hypothetical protein [Streptomyces sp. CB02923]OKI02556.1 hypothetical protein A6A06_16200 [Streptomyces sp. CB02923]
MNAPAPGGHPATAVDPPAHLIAWATGHLGPIADPALLSTSNSRVWRVRDEHGRRYALKHLLDASSMPAAEHAVRTELAGSPRLCGLRSVLTHPDGSAYLLADYVPGPTLDSVLPTAGHSAGEWAGRLADLLDELAAVKVAGFGKLDADMTADQPSWSAFLHTYLDEQRGKAPALARMRHDALRELLTGLTTRLDEETPEPGLVAADINNRNFVVSDTGPVCVNLPVLWAGDPAAAFGQALIHWAGSAGTRVLAERSGAPAWRLHFYAAYHAYVILAYVERFAPVPLTEATPWGANTPLLDLFDTHAQQARAAAETEGAWSR